MRSCNFNELVESLSRANTVEDLHAACSAMCQQSGFDRFLYGAPVPASFVKPCFIFVSGYPREWRERYTTNGYMRIDPTGKHCAANLTPICLNQVEVVDDTSSQVRGFTSEAQEFGLRSGVSFPIHSAQGEFAMLNFASGRGHPKARSLILAAIPYASLFSAHLHERAMALSTATQSTRCFASVTRFAMNAWGGT